MGTRNLTAVMVDGEYKVAQYGQWDGYPDGQGLTVLRFLRDKMDRTRFLERLRMTHYVTQQELDDAYRKAGLKEGERFLTQEVAERFEKLMPFLSRDICAKVLEQIHDSEGEVLLKDSLSFAGDSLFCEWGWVVDFDKNTLEAYSGYNRGALPETERFASIIDPDGNGPAIRLVAQFQLDALPSDEAFLETFKDDDEDES